MSYLQEALGNFTLDLSVWAQREVHIDVNTEMLAAIEKALIDFCEMASVTSTHIDRELEKTVLESVAPEPGFEDIVIETISATRTYLGIE